MLLRSFTGIPQFSSLDHFEVVTVTSAGFGANLLLDMRDVLTILFLPRVINVKV